MTAFGRNGRPAPLKRCVNVVVYDVMRRGANLGLAQPRS